MTFDEWWQSVAAHRMTWSRRMAAEYAWDAARADIEAVLVSKHGGEPLSLLAELDACRDLAAATRPVEGEVGALIAKLNAYNPPDRTVAEQRQISVDIHNAASLLERLARERDEANQHPWRAALEGTITAMGVKLEAAERALADAKRKLHQFVTLAKAQGIEVTMIECGDENSDDPH